MILYAQRGHGKRSSFYSDYTLGAWREGENGAELVPVCKAYSGFSDAELRKLDKFVRPYHQQDLAQYARLKASWWLKSPLTSCISPGGINQGLRCAFRAFMPFAGTSWQKKQIALIICGNLFQRARLIRFLASASLGAIFDLIPIPGPFFAPGKGLFTGQADFLAQIAFSNHFG